jgi:pantetheine-phosphate adenylyltransferase
MRRAVYAGSFDPITIGHLWMVREGAGLFDELIVAIGINPEKRATFTLEERLEMLRESLVGQPNISVTHFSNQFLVRYAASVNAQYILRGIRSEGDFDYERAIRQINSDLCPEITTVFLVPPREISEISSSMVKGLIGPEGWESIVQQYVPEGVFRHMIKKFQAK